MEEKKAIKIRIGSDGEVVELGNYEKIIQQLESKYSTEIGRLQTLVASLSEKITALENRLNEIDDSGESGQGSGSYGNHSGS